MNRFIATVEQEGDSTDLTLHYVRRVEINDKVEWRQMTAKVRIVEVTYQIVEVT